MDSLFCCYCGLRSKVRFCVQRMERRILDSRVTSWTQVFRINSIIDAIISVFDAIIQIFDAITLPFDAIIYIPDSMPQIPNAIHHIIAKKSSILDEIYTLTTKKGIQHTCRVAVSHILKKFYKISADFQ
jgi:TM2 domain-containing membrane protein YozV